YLLQVGKSARKPTAQLAPRQLPLTCSPSLGMDARRGVLDSPVGLDHLGRRLHQLDEHAFASDGRLAAPLGVDEADVVAPGALPEATRRHGPAAGPGPAHRRREVVDPEADVVERRLVDARPASRVERLHEIDLHRERTQTGRGDVLVDVLALAPEVALRREPQQIDPQPTQSALVRGTDGDLLDAEDP